MAHLLMRQVFAALQCVFSAFHGLSETGIFLEIPGNDLLSEFVRRAALLGCREGQLRFGFRWEMYFHAVSTFHQNSGYAAAPGSGCFSARAGI
jgi:hypothetical protein